MFGFQGLNNTSTLAKEVQQQQNYNTDLNNCILRNHLYCLIMSPSSSNKIPSIDTKNDNNVRKNNNSDNKNDSE